MNNRHLTLSLKFQKIRFIFIFLMKFSFEDCLQIIQIQQHFILIPKQSYTPKQYLYILDQERILISFEVSKAVSNLCY